MEKKDRNLILYILLFISIFAVIYFFINTSPNERTKVEEKPDSIYLKLAVLPTIECLPFYVAKEYGIADSLDLNLQLFEYESAMDADTAFVNHSVDGIASEMIKLSIYQSKGDSVTAVIGGECYMSLITGKHSRINSIKELKDKIVAITRHSIVDYFIDKVIAMGPKDSLTLNIPQINNIRVRQDMILQNQIDGGVLPEPYSSFCIEKGCKLISKISEIKESNEMFALIIQDSVLINRKSEIKKLISVYNLSVDYINSHSKNERKNFLKLLSFTDSISDSIFTFPHYTHANSPSSTNFAIAKQWIQNRGIAGKNNKSNIMTSDFIPIEGDSKLLIPQK